ncbi:protocadherin Fat 4-like [Haliotis rufescens]|uniref:protocadherin Fat 4-like n=1 Tax=Haliotis rufescens TaxID=6454 RepID=UPI00201EDCEF|nr:protocadherin Fat 4-like [Haliotis rufescens]
MADTMSVCGQLWALTFLTLVHQSVQVPRFLNAPYLANIRYDVDVGHIVATARANDPGLKGSLRFDTTGVMPAPGFFAVNSATGVITVAASLRSDTLASYTLGVVVYDTAAPKTTASTNVTININRNPQSPTPAALTMETTILETRATGSSLLIVSAVDPDLTAVHFDLVDTRADQQSSQYFTVDYNTGSVMVRRSLTLDPARHTTYNFGVRVTDSGLPPRSSAPVSVKVNVVRNMFTPTFIGVPYTANINRTAEPGDAILSLIAVDADGVSSFSSLRYSMCGNSHSDMFAVNAETGEISLVGNLNETKQYRYKFGVRVEDGGTPPLSATTGVEVTVDYNLYDPTFQTTSHTRRIVETLAVESNVLTFTVTDEDGERPEGDIELTILEPRASNFFKVETLKPSLGVISLKQSLIRDDTRRYEFTVTAVDKGTPARTATTSATFVIDVTRNEHAPQFLGQPYQAAMSVTAKPGTMVFSVRAADADTQAPFNNISFSLIGDARGPSFFRVNTNTGVITVTETSLISTDQAPSYTLRVLAEDGGTPALSATTTVLIAVDRNLYSPVLASRSFNASILSSHPVGYPSFLKLTAVDGDIAEPYNVVRYSITGDVKFKEYFIINMDDGQISVKKDIQTDPSQTRQYNGGIQVCDAASNPRCTFVAVVVNIVRNDNAPSFINIDDYTVSINSTQMEIGYSVLKIAAVDRDTDITDNTVNYKLFNIDDTVDYFHIDSSTGNVTIKAVPPVTTDRTFELWVEACDTGKFCNRTVARVTVLTNFYAPVFSSTQYTTTVSETVGYNVPIIAVTATDADITDPNNRVRYKLTFQLAECFSVDELTGEISIQKSLLDAFCSEDSYLAQITAVDGGAVQRSSTVDVFLTVRRNKHAPVFTANPFLATIQGGAPAGTRVLSVLATDNDVVAPFNVLTFSTFGQDDTHFDINPNTGVLTVKPSLQTDRREQYTFFVMVKDGGSPPLSATTEVGVSIQRNLNPPIFSPLVYSVAILSTQTLNTPIAIVLATDADVSAPNNFVTFNVAGSGGFGNFFAIDRTGRVLVTRDLREDADKQTVYNGVVNACDGGASPLCSPSAAIITISVTRNNFAPSFVDDDITQNVTSRAPLNTIVMQVVATDRDPPSTPFGQVRYKLLNKDDTQDFFTVDSNSGDVRISRPLFNSQKPSFELLVEACDLDRLCNTTLATVHVMRNLFAPEMITQDSFDTIPETWAIGRTLLTATAIDRDVAAPNNVVMYSISGSEDAMNCFTINPHRGHVTLQRSLMEDPCNLTNYVVQVRAMDGGNPSRSATTEVTAYISIIRNRYTPQFINNTDSISVMGNVSTGVIVYTVTATDNDALVFGDVSFELTGDTETLNFFRMDPDTGDIVTIANLTDTRKSVLSARVVARDEGTPPRENITVVNINITNNHYDPVFTMSSYVITIPESTSRGTVLTTVSAVDLDTVWDNGDVEYLLKDSESSNNDFCAIDRETGEVYLLKDLSDTTTFTCQIEARDKAPKPRSDTALVNVLVLPTQQLTFARSDISVTITDKQDVGRTVTQVQVEQAVTVGYSLIGTDRAPIFFDVNITTGAIYVSTQLTSDPDKLTSYQLLVEAKGLDGLSSATTSVNVTVVRQNNDPVFSPSRYTVNVYEDQTPGTSLISTTAVDREGDMILYNISGPGSDLFLMHPLTGEVFLMTSLGEESSNTYQLNLHARGVGSQEPEPMGTLTINVIRDIGVPYFEGTPYMATLNFSASKGDSVMRVVALDFDLNGDLKYDIGGQYFKDKFGINNDTGEITVTGRLPRDTERYTLIVNAYDSRFPQNKATTSVVISVNVNPNPPVCQPRPISTTVTGDTAPGDVIADANATDADGDDLTYAFANIDSEDRSQFFLESTSGKLFLRRAFTNIRATYTFSVRAADQYSRSCVIFVSISVLSDTPPLFIGDPYTVTVLENSPPGSSVVMVTAQDSDLRGSLAYEISGKLSAPAYFDVGRNTGMVTLNSSLINSCVSRYTIQVSVFDTAAPTAVTMGTVQVNVIRNPNGPVWASSTYSVTITDSTAAGTDILNTTAVDSDGDSIRYEFGRGSNTDLFRIDVDTGTISLRTSLTADTTGRQVYLLPLIARDQRDVEKRAIATATINVRRDTQSPRFTNTQYRVTVLESSPVNSSLIIVSAADNDLQGRIQYELTGDEAATLFFRVSADTGQIVLRRDLKMDSSISYTIRIKAYDSAYPANAATTTVSVSVVRNANTPISSQPFYTTSIPENTPPGTSLLTVNGTDVDGDTISYEIVRGDNVTQEFFKIDDRTGVLTVGSDLTSSLVPSTVMVRMSDNGVPQKYTDVSVRVLLRRDSSSPRFINAPFSTNLLDTVAVNTTVMTVTAIDDDLLGAMKYKINEDSLAKAYFGIDADTGRVFTRRRLTLTNVERFDVEVTAYDSTYPGNTATTVAAVRISNTQANDNTNAPVFSLSDYAVTVYEYVDCGFSILRVTASDADGDAVQYQIIRSPGDPSLVNIDPVSGDIYVRQSLATYQDNTYIFTVEASDQRRVARTSRVVVNVTIERDVPIVIVNLPSTVTVNESTAVGEVVFTVQAIDPNRVGSVQYEVVGGIIAVQYFNISDTGNVMVSASLRDIKTQTLTLQIKAWKTNSSATVPKVQGTLNINVRINGNAPRFISAPYDVTISPDRQIGEEIIAVSTFDWDREDNVTYSIDGGSDYLYIHPVTGSVILTKSLRNVNISQIVTTVKAVDRMLFPRMATAVLTVNIRSDVIYPEFGSTPYNISIPDTLAVQSSVFTVYAIDNDLRGQLMYQVTGVYPSPYFFSLSPFGRITLIRPLAMDTLASSRYDLRIVAFDATAPDTRGTVTVTINVARNPNGPLATQALYSVNVSEVASLDTVLFTIVATDLDGDDLTYRLSDGESYFSINDTGDISATRSLLGLGGKRFFYTVTITDSGRPSKTTEVGLAVSVMSGKPIFSASQYDVTIRDDALAGTPVTNVTAVTPLQGRVTYDVEGYGLAPVFFDVDKVTGSVTVTRDLKQGTDRQYTLRVLAYDDGYPNYYSTANVTISVVRNVNSPLFVSASYKASIEDGMELGAVVTSSISATDADGDTVTYSIVSTDQCSTLLAIDASSGVIRLRRLPSTSFTNLSCRIQATDNSYYLAKTASVVMEVSVNQGQYPVFDARTYVTTLTEQAPVTSVVFTIKASKPNLAGTMMYELIGVYPAPNFFFVNITTGDVSIRTDLQTDAAATPQYNLKLVAYDSSNPSRRATVDGTVVVTRNVYGPEFASTVVQTKVDFDVDIETWCFPVTVADRDNDVVTCTFSDLTAVYADFFTIDPRTCVVTLNQSLTADNATTNRFRMNIMATDDGRPPRVATMVLIVNVARDGFMPSIVNLPTSVNKRDTDAVGSPVYTVSVSDPDVQGDRKCDIIGDGLATALFQIDNLNRITLRTSLTVDSRSSISYVVRVRCYDTAWPTHTVDGELTVSVSRTSTTPSDCNATTNNNAPVFSVPTYVARVSRSASPGEVIIGISATDSDGDVIRYSVLTSSIGALSYFYLDPVTGQIITRNSKLAEDTNQNDVSYNLRVAATDPYGGQSTTTVYITVQPLQLPVFSQGSYMVTVPAAVAPGQTITTIAARKADLKGILLYKLTGVFPSIDYFILNEVTGELSVNKTLLSDDTLITRHKLIVVAYDTGELSSEAATEVIITVVATNPTSPIFSQPDYNVTLSQLLPIGGKVYTLTALDQDGDNVTYSDRGTNLTRKYFFVNPRNGDITLINDLTASTESRFSFVVAATDDGYPRKSSQALVTISIQTQDKRPSFEYSTCNKDSSGKCVNPTYSATITSGTTGGLTVYPSPGVNPPAPTDILARDTDGGKRIVYTVEQTDPAGYAIFFNVTSSVVTSTSDLYRATLTQIIPINRRNVRDLTLVLTARERSSVGMSAIALVYVTIGSSNDNPPIIGSSTNSFTGYIREDAETSFFVKDSPLQNAMRLTYSDQDVVLGDPVQNYVSSVQGTDSFSVDPDGYIRLARTLDYDTKNRYTFQVTVSERDTALRRSATVSLTVSVIKTPPPASTCDCNKPTSGTWACTASRLARYLPTILLVLFMKYI